MAGDDARRISSHHGQDLLEEWILRDDPIEGFHEQAEPVFAQVGVGSVLVDSVAEQGLIAHGVSLEATVEPHGPPQEGEQCSRDRGEQKTLLATSCGPDTSAPQARDGAKLLLSAEGFFDVAAFGVELDDIGRDAPKDPSDPAARGESLDARVFPWISSRIPRVFGHRDESRSLTLGLPAPHGFCACPRTT